MNTVFLYESRLTGVKYAVINKDVMGQTHKGLTTNNVIFTDGTHYFVKELNEFEDEFKFLSMFTTKEFIFNKSMIDTFIAKYEGK